MMNTKGAVKTAEEKYPPQNNTLVFIFDQNNPYG